MNVGEYVGVILLPLDTLGKVGPQCTVIGIVHEIVVTVQLNHSRAAGKSTAELAESSCIAKVLGCHILLFLPEEYTTLGIVVGQDESVSHQCIDWTQRRILHIMLVYKLVTVCNPILAVAAVVTQLAIVVLLTPSSISKTIPEW